ncbi:hypothetical protein D3C86_1985480 [compost metagenome]
MHNQVGRQRAGNGKKASHTTGDIVIDRSGGRQDRRRFREGGELGLHHDKGDQHRQREGIAADAETAGHGEDHRAGHNHPDRAGQRGRESDLAPLKMGMKPRRQVHGYFLL